MSVEDVFLELLFGEGALLGCLLIVTIIVVVSSMPRMKYASILFVPFTLLFGITYLNNIESSSIYMWCSVIMFCTLGYIMLRMAFGEDR